MRNISNNIKKSIFIRNKIIKENRLNTYINWTILYNKHIIKHLNQYFIIEKKEKGFIFNKK